MDIDVNESGEGEGKVGNDDAKSYRVMLVDDHPVVRQGVRVLISQEADMSVCGEAGSVVEANRMVEELRPDLVVLDLKLGNGSGLDLIPRLLKIVPTLPVVIFSMHDESLYAERALRAGACGYVMKDSAPDVLLCTIRRALAGEGCVFTNADKRVTGYSAGGSPFLNSLPVVLDSLSSRELQVFRMIGGGIATKGIASELGLSVKTVDSHRANIKRKLRLQNGAELVRKAIHWVDHENGASDL